GLDLNQRPPGYEPDELPTALPRDMSTFSQGAHILYHGFAQMSRKKKEKHITNLFVLLRITGVGGIGQLEPEGNAAFHILHAAAAVQRVRDSADQRQADAGASGPACTCAIG